MAKRSFWSFLFGSEEAQASSGSADKATERLKVIVASQNRSLNSRLDDARIEQMKREILQIVNKYINGVNMDNVNISHRKEESIDLLEMSINLPEQEKKKAEMQSLI